MRTHIAHQKQQQRPYHFHDIHRFVPIFHETLIQFFEGGKLKCQWWKTGVVGSRRRRHLLLLLLLLPYRFSKVEATSAAAAAAVAASWLVVVVCWGGTAEFRLRVVVEEEEEEDTPTVEFEYEDRPLLFALVLP
mmetsp:Transcript_12849/g.19933  ORF Transcript_12849/g.19933 Transcript_12849/m.19933 type:complete len:134 (-) Transcript_12849:2024-2425(-)